MAMTVMECHYDVSRSGSSSSSSSSSSSRSSRSSSSALVITLTNETSPCLRADAFLSGLGSQGGKQKKHLQDFLVESNFPC